MAISFVGSAVNSSAGNASNPQSVDISGLSVAANDLIIVACGVGDTTSNGIAAPGGYTRLPGTTATLYQNDTNDNNLDVYYLVAAGGETAVQWAPVGGANGSNAVVVMVFRGVDTTTPFDTNANTDGNINTATANPPSHDHSGTSGVWTVMIASVGHTGGNTASATFPTGYTTNAAQRAHDDTIDIWVGMGYNSGPSDPEDPGTITPSPIGTAADDSWNAITVSLKEKVSSPVTVTPGAFSLTYTAATPTVTASDHKTATPGAFSLAYTPATPTVTATANTGVTPGAFSLAYTPAAPTVSVTENKVVTPGAFSLAYTPAAPSVVLGTNVTPGSFSLAYTPAEPTVTVSDHKVVTPGAFSLAMTMAAPDVTATGEAPQPTRRHGGWRMLPAEREDERDDQPAQEKETEPQTAGAVRPSGALTLPVKSAAAVLIKPLVIDGEGVRRAAVDAARDEVKFQLRKRRRRAAAALLLLS